MSSLVDTWFLSGDFAGYILAIYTSVYGQMFYGVLLFGFTVPLYIRYQSIVPPLLVAIAFTTFLEVVIPPEAFIVIRFLLGLGVATVLYLLYTRRGVA